MSTNDGFAILVLRVLLSVLALLIMVPMFDNSADVPFYVTVCVYLLGKLVDLAAKIMRKQFFLMLLIYMAGVIICIAAIGICFLGIASVGIVPENVVGKFVGTAPYNFSLIIMSALICLVDLIEFLFCLGRIMYTKKKLGQFND